jgi:hypothetical protein
LGEEEEKKMGRSGKLAQEEEEGKGSVSFRL